MHARHNMKNYFYFRHYNFDITKVDLPLIFFVSCMKYANFQYSGKRHIYLVRVFVYYVENYNYCNIVNYFPVV